jgi:hypothetical protein
MRRHSTDLVSLVFGLVFAVVAGWWLVGRYVMNVNLHIPNFGFIAAGILILLGLLGAIGSLRRDRAPAEATTEFTAASPAPTPAPTEVDDPTWPSSDDEENAVADDRSAGEDVPRGSAHRE